MTPIVGRRVPRGGTATIRRRRSGATATLGFALASPTTLAPACALARGRRNGTGRPNHLFPLVLRQSHMLPGALVLGASIMVEKDEDAQGTEGGHLPL